MPNRFWVGGAATWDTTAGLKWSTTSGGSGGAAVPTNVDDVFFDAASGSVNVTVGSGTRACKTLTCTGFTGTLSGTGAMTVSGSFLLVAGMTYTNTGLVTIQGNGVTTFTSAGKTINRLTITMISNTCTLTDALIVTSNLTINLGTFDTGNQTITAGNLTTTASPTVNLGSSVITLSANVAVAISTTTTLNAGTSSISCTFASTAATLFTGGGKTFYDVAIAATITKTITDSNTFHNLTLTNSTDKRAILITGNQTITGTFSVTGNSSTSRIIVQSPTLGTASTLTAAAVSLSNCDFMDITGAGAATWSGTSVGNALGNSNITFTTPVTRYFVGAVGTSPWSSTGSWATSSGGASGASVPLCHDNVIFDNSGIATIVSFDMPRLCANLTMTARTAGALTLNITSPSNSAIIYGSFYQPTVGCTWGSSNAITLNLRGRSSLDFNSAGQSLSYPIIIEMIGGTLTMQSNMTATRTVTLTNGTLDANNKNLTFGAFVSNGTLTRTITMGSGTWAVGNATVSGTVWDLSTTTGLTLNQNTSTLKIITDSTVTNVFAGGGLTYYNIWFAKVGGSSILQATGSNTFNDMKMDGGLNVQSAAGTTTTFASFSPQGSAGNLTVINSITSATYSFSKVGGGSTSVDYVSVSWNTGISAMIAGSNSVNGGNNVNWTFSSGSNSKFFQFF